jgi:UrcA family protein
MNSIIKFAIAATIAATSTTAMFSATVHARTAGDQASLRVETADLNLSSQAGQRKLSLRIERAANEVCDANNTLRDLQARRTVSECIAKATSHALAQVKHRDGQPLALKTTD